MTERSHHGPIALVTGAAGGIGRAIVANLASKGISIAAVDQNIKELELVVANLTQDGALITAFPANIASSKDVDRLIKKVENELGPIEYLVNAAGVLRLGDALSITDDDWETIFSVNTSGVFFVSRAVVSRMARRGRGAMVTVTSNAATTPRMHMAAYAASKAASSMFTKCLGLEVAEHGVRCNIVAPGSTQTQMLSSLWANEQGPDSSIKGVQHEFRVGIPLGKLGQPNDVAAAVAFLLSEEAGHITMHELTVDGGATLGS